MKAFAHISLENAVYEGCLKYDYSLQQQFNQQTWQSRIKMISRQASNCSCKTNTCSAVKKFLWSNIFVNCAATFESFSVQRHILLLKKPRRQSLVQTLWDIVEMFKLQKVRITEIRLIEVIY